MCQVGVGNNAQNAIMKNANIVKNGCGRKGMSAEQRNVQITPSVFRTHIVIAPCIKSV